MATEQNLQAAFAGESQANRKYLAFARKAEEDGLTQVARLFRAAAEAETVHAHAHLRVLGGIQSTAENLETAIAGEGEEFRDMYPKFLDEARADNAKAAERSFSYAMAVEEIHHGLYSKALEAVRAGNDLPPAPLSICPVCGNTVEGAVPEACPICGVPGSRFVSVD